MTVDRIDREVVAGPIELLDQDRIACLQWGFKEAALACGDFRIEDVDPALIADAMIGWLKTYATECAADNGQLDGVRELLERICNADDDQKARWLVAAALIGDSALQVPSIEQETGGVMAAWFGYSGAWVQVSHAARQQQTTGSALQVVSDAVPSASAPTGASGPLVVPDVSPYPIPGVTHSRGWLAAAAYEAGRNRLRMQLAQSDEPI